MEELEYTAALKGRNSGLYWPTVKAKTEQEAQIKMRERAKSVGCVIYGGVFLNSLYK